MQTMLKPLEVSLAHQIHEVNIISITPKTSQLKSSKKVFPINSSIQLKLKTISSSIVESVDIEQLHPVYYQWQLEISPIQQTLLTNHVSNQPTSHVCFCIPVKIATSTNPDLMMPLNDKNKNELFFKRYGYIHIHAIPYKP